MSIPGFIFGEGQAAKTPEQLRKMRAIAEALAVRTSAPKNVGEGLQAIGDALMYRKMMGDADRGETEGRAGASGEVREALFGGSPTPYIDPNASVRSALFPKPGAADELAATSPSPATGMEAYRNAIASIESDGSGGYGAVGPTHPKLGRAMGRYQIMEANIGPWSQEALGRAVTPDEFMADPKLQDAIFDKKFGSYVEKYGPERAAQAWFAGPGGIGKMDRKDSLGTSVSAYSQKFNNAVGATPAAAIEAVAPGSGYVDPMVAAANAQPPVDPNQPPAFDPGRFGDPIKLAEDPAAMGDAGQRLQTQATAYAANPQGPVAGLQPTPGQQTVAQALNDRGIAPPGAPQPSAGVSSVANAMAANQAPFDAGRFGDPIRLSEMPAGTGDAGQRMVAQAMAYAANPNGPVAGLQPQGAPQLPSPTAVGAPPSVAAAAPAQGAKVAGDGYFPPAPLPPGQQSQGDVLTVQRIQKALMNPWLTDAQEKLLLGELARRQQEYDPDTILKREHTRAQIAALEKKAAGQGDEEWGLNPVWGKDKEGKTVLGQVSKTGKFKPLDTGDFQPTPGLNVVDTGTEVITRNSRTGQTISTTPKDLAGAERDKAGGKAQGEAQAAMPQVENAANELLSSIDALANDPYLDKMVGAIDSKLPNVSSDAARVQSRMNQIGGQSFMQAFNSLRGAGQITEQEGAKATAAMSRLATAQNEKDYRDALNDLRGVVQRAVETSRLKANGNAAPAATNGKTGRAGSVNWSIEP